MEFEHVLVERSGEFVTITMNRPQRRNALSLRHMRELIAAFTQAGGSDALGIVLAGNGPVFSAGHDFADVADADLTAVRSLLQTCTELMTLMQQVPQPVVARVHGLATAAGCQLVATADLAVASENAGFAAPGGKGGWFCHTPMVAIARNIGRKRAAEMALSGDIIDAPTALEWGLVNRVVPAQSARLCGAGSARTGHAGLRGEQGHRQTGALRSDRPRPAEGIRLRHRGDGRHQPATGRARGNARLSGQAQAAMESRAPVSRG